MSSIYQDTILPKAYDQKMRFEKSRSFERVPYDQLINPNNRFRHSGSWGVSGCGKTTNRIAIIEVRQKLGFKCVAIDTQEELEFIHLPCPPDHVLYPILAEQNRKPKGIPTKILLPLAYTGGKRVIMQEEIPVHWQPFLLDLYDLEVTTKDWDTLVGGLSGVREQILKTALLKKEPTWGILDVYLETQKRFVQKDYGYPDITEDDIDSEPIPVLKGIFPKQSITTLNRNLMDLNSARFLAPRIWRGKITPYLLDWEKEILDRRYVTILKVGLLPPNLAHTLVTYLIRKAFIMAQKRFTQDGRKVPPISFVVPEATNFFPKEIPSQYKETMPPLRDAFMEIFLRGRRHQVVIDYDTAYYTNLPDEVKAQTVLHYAFMYDNVKEILNEFVNSRNPINKENLTSGFDLLKERGTCLYFNPTHSRGVFLHNIVPACHVAREGENFIELWKSIGGKMKSVEPYYATLNLIHQDIKEKVRKEFQGLEEKIMVSGEIPLSETPQKFAVFLYSLILETGETEFIQSNLVNRYYMEPNSKVSKVTIYALLKQFHKLGILTIHKEKKPNTIIINLEKLRSMTRQEGQENDGPTEVEA